MVMASDAHHDAPLIPRKLLFGNASRFGAELSPDGTMLSWHAPVDGVMNIWLAPLADLDAARPITRTKGRPINWHAWSADGQFLFFLNDENGDENHHLFAVDHVTGKLRNLTPYGKVSTQLQLWSQDLPNCLIVGLNDRDPHWHDLWSIDLASGERTLIYENTQHFGSFVFDWQGNLRLGRRSAPAKGGAEIFRFGGGRLDPWRFIPFEDELSTYSIAFNRQGTHLAVGSSLGRDKTALVRIDMATGDETVLAAHPTADLTARLLDPETYEVDAVAADPIRREWIILKEAVRPAFNLIAEAAPGREFFVQSQSDNNRRWIVCTYASDEPATYHLLDRDAMTMRNLFNARPELSAHRLAGMEGVVIKSRDGLDLVSYLTVPADHAPRPKRPLPMVLFVHGGPWARDDYGYRGDHQWLANRGYAVLSVNYRASWGFGKAFLNAGDKEHAGKIHDDLLDAVAWAVGEGVADSNRVAIMGWSYGGYAAFVGATFTPDVFCCTVPIVGISDLITLMENRPPYWADFMEQFNRRYADVRTEDGRAWLRSRSPITKCDAITKPMLIGHGANDVRCTLAQSDMIVDAMEKKGLDVAYVVFPDEGHGFYRPENRLAFFAVVEAFLAKHMRGRCEPVGHDFEGSSHEIRAGASRLSLK
jgi:dipeptidyl aminopeptidase/acylaminoacyl peptidase